MKWCTDSRVHAIWSFRERSYKEPLVLAKNKESLINILGLKAIFAFWECLTIEISGPKEQYFFSVISSVLAQQILLERYVFCI